MKSSYQPGDRVTHHRRSTPNVLRHGVVASTSWTPLYGRHVSYTVEVTWEDDDYAPKFMLSNNLYLAHDNPYDLDEVS